MTNTLAILFLLLVPALLSGQVKPTPKFKPLVFTHATVIDATGAPARRDMSIVIVDGRIIALGKTGKVRVPADAQIIDATGKFLIPGLWDMHIHSGGYENGKKYFPRL